VRPPQVFKSEDGLQSHYKQSLDHHFCTECQCDFDDEDDLWDHAEDDHHACRECHEVSTNSDSNHRTCLSILSSGFAASEQQLKANAHTLRSYSAAIWSSKNTIATSTTTAPVAEIAVGPRTFSIT
jgi:hypothetical protein